MATDREIKKIQLDLEDLLISVDNIDEKDDDIHNMERNIQELNANYDKIDDRYSRIKEEIEEQTECEKPLIDRKLFGRFFQGVHCPLLRREERKQRPL